MSLCEGAMIEVKVGAHLSEEYEVGVGVHLGSVLSPLLFTIVADVVMKGLKEGTLQVILYVGDLVLIVETMVYSERENFMVGKVHLSVKVYK